MGLISALAFSVISLRRFKDATEKVLFQLSESVVNILHFSPVALDVSQVFFFLTVCSAQAYVNVEL